MSKDESLFVPSDGNKAEGGVIIFNKDRTSGEEEVGNVGEDIDDEEEVGNYEVGTVDEDIDYEEEVGNDYEFTDDIGIEVGSE